MGPYAEAGDHLTAVSPSDAAGASYTLMVLSARDIASVRDWHYECHLAEYATDVL